MRGLALLIAVACIGLAIWLTTRDRETADSNQPDAGAGAVAKKSDSAADSTPIPPTEPTVSAAPVPKKQPPVLSSVPTAPEVAPAPADPAATPATTTTPTATATAPAPSTPPPLPTPAAPAEDPPALIEYKGRVIAQTMHWRGAEWLQRKTREQEENGHLMRKQLDVKPGQAVCDLGSGDGYHTLWMSGAVGEKGLVYAVDIQQEMLDMLEKRAAGRGMKNIKTVLGKFWDPMLPPNSQDLILLVDAYHEFSHPEHMLKAMRTALKPTGRMVLVEFRTEDPEVPIKPEHKMSKAQILKEIPPMGFKLVKEFDGLPWQHMMFFEPAEVQPPVPEKGSSGPGQ